MNCLTGFFYGLSALALAASPLEDEELDFAAAVEKTPINQQALAKLPYPYPPGFVVSSLLQVEQHSKVQPVSRAMLTAIQVLMTSHPSPEVQAKGEKLLGEIRIQLDHVEQDFLTKVNTAIDHAREAVKKTKQPSDLDPVLAELDACTWPGTTPAPVPPRRPGMFPYQPPDPMEQMMERQRILASGITPAAQDAQNRAANIRDFVTAWQDYLAATTLGNTVRANEALQSIVSNSTLTALNLIPRSQLLGLESTGSASSATSLPNPVSTTNDFEKAATEAFAKIKTADEVGDAVNRLNALPNHADLSTLFNLNLARINLQAGLPVTIDFQKAMHENVFGTDVSHAVALEVLDLLPDYLGTRKSHPPHPDDTVNGYLERLMTQAEKDDDLALLQRALAVRISMAETDTQPDEEGWHRPVEFALGAMSQDAAGQVAAAVFSYETALGSFDPLVPAGLIGKRLAKLRLSHPKEFQRGYDQFMAQNHPNYRAPTQGIVEDYAPGAISVLPVSSTISTSGRQTTNKSETSQ